MANDQEEYERAKKEGERIFLQALTGQGWSPEFPFRINLSFQADGMMDSQMHADVLTIIEDKAGGTDLAIFDVKDVKAKNMGTGNYTLGRKCVDFFKKFVGHGFFAFRLNDGKSQRLESFVVAPARDVVCSCSLTELDDGEYLCPLAEVKEKCPSWWILEKDF